MFDACVIIQIFIIGMKSDSFEPEMEQNVSLYILCEFDVDVTYALDYVPTAYNESQDVDGVEQLG